MLIINEILNNKHEKKWSILFLLLLLLPLFCSLGIISNFCVSLCDLYFSLIQFLLLRFCTARKKNINVLDCCFVCSIKLMCGIFFFYLPFFFLFIFYFILFYFFAFCKFFFFCIISPLKTRVQLKKHPRATMNKHRMNESTIFWRTYVKVRVCHQFYIECIDG